MCWLLALLLMILVHNGAVPAALLDAQYTSLLVKKVLWLMFQAHVSLKYACSTCIAKYMFVAAEFALHML